jgi:AhpD family alkylhydroperoxidase
VSPHYDKEITVESRVNYFGHPFGGKVLKHINSAGKVVSDSTLPAAIQELVKIRASQINGCGFCTDMHTKEAALAGPAHSVLVRHRVAPPQGHQAFPSDDRVHGGSVTRAVGVATSARTLSYMWRVADVTGT